MTLKCNAFATFVGKLLSNRFDVGMFSLIAILRIESQGNYDRNRLYLLFTGSLGSHGLEVNSEGSLTFDTGCNGLHNALIMVSKNSLSTSVTNKVECKPVTMENIFSGAIDNGGASLSSRTKAVAGESRGELNIEDKITATEASLYGFLMVHAYNATTRSSMNIVVNKRALIFTSNIMGALKKMTTENSHAMTLTLWTLTLCSETNNFICENISYNQDTRVDMKPFVMSFDITNDLKFHDVIINSEGHMKFEPHKADLIGSMRGAYGEEHNIKNIYELNYDNTVGTLKYNMTGIVMNAQLSHNCDLNFVGFSSKSKL